METTEKFCKRKYFERTGTNIYAAPRRGVNKEETLAHALTHYPKVC